MFSGPNLFDQIQSNLQTQSAQVGITNNQTQNNAQSDVNRAFNEESLFSSSNQSLFGDDRSFLPSGIPQEYQRDQIQDSLIQTQNFQTVITQSNQNVQILQKPPTQSQQILPGMILGSQRQQSSNAIGNDLVGKKQPIQIVAPSNKQINHPGEVIPSRCYVYHSISELASKIDEQQALSIELTSKKAKVFNYQDQNILALQQGDTDIQLVINQQDQIPNILDSFHQMGTLPGSIVDFTISLNKTLYLLYQSQIEVIDISPLMAGDIYAQPQLIDQIGVPGLFTRIDSAMEGKYLVLVHKQKASILLIKVETNQQSSFSLENEDQRSIRDIDIYGSLICVLYDKNEIAVFDILTNQRVFKSGFRDPTAQVSRIFYIAEFHDDSPNSKALTQSSYQYDASQPFSGYFLLVENQVQKVLKQSSSLHSSSKKEIQKSATKTTFERLYVVKAINNQQKGGKTPSNQKPNGQDNQSILQQDFLKLSEKTAKLVEYDRSTGLIFLLNCDKPQQSIQLCSVKILRPQSSEKPRFLKFIAKQNQNEMKYYLYVAVGNQVLTFEQDYDELLPNIDKIREYSEGGFIMEPQQQVKPVIQQSQSSSLFGNDFFSQMSDPGLFIPPQQTEQKLSSKSSMIQDKLQQDDTTILDPEFQQTQQFLEKFLNLGSYNKDNQSQVDKFKSSGIDNDEEIKMEQQQVNRELEKAIENVLRDDIILKDNPLNINYDDNEEEKVQMTTSISDPVQQLQPKLLIKTSEEDSKKGSVDEPANQKGLIPFVAVQAPSQKKKKSKKKEKNGTTGTASQIIPSQQSSVIKDTQQFLAQNSVNQQQVQTNQSQIRPQILQNPNTINQQKDQQQTSATNLTNLQQPQVLQPSLNPTVNNYPVYGQNIPQNQSQSAINLANQSQSGKKVIKNSQELMIENYKELTRKYQELAQKLSQMQRQVQNQSNQQIEIDKSIQKNIKTCLPGIIEQSLKEMVVPIITNNMRTIDMQVRDNIMPQVENQILQLFTTFQNKESSKQKSQVKESSQGNQQSSNKNVSESKLKEIITNQFNLAMNTQIKPMLEEQMKQVVEQTQQSLIFANLQFENKLKQEEAKNNQIVKFYQTKIEQLIEQQGRTPLNVSYHTQRQPPPVPMYPPPYMYPPHPAYQMPPYPYPTFPPTHEQAYMQPPPGLPLLEQKSQSMHGQYMSNPLPAYHNQQQQQYQGFTSNPQNQKTAQTLTGVNKISDFSDDEDELSEFKPLHAKNQKLLENSDCDAQDQNDLDEATKQKQIQYRSMLDKFQKQAKQQNEMNQNANTPFQSIITSNGQQVLMFNEDDITPLPGGSSNRLFSKDSSFQGSSQFIQTSKLGAQNNSQSKQKQQSKLQAQQQQTQNSTTPPQTSSQKTSKQKVKSQHEHILTYIKSVANGQPKLLDQLFTINKPFLKEIMSFLVNSIQELNLLHANIIAQFLKKIYDRAKMDDAPKLMKSEGYVIYTMINNKICKQREDMKLVLPKINEMEKVLEDMIKGEIQIPKQIENTNSM
eukprot:403351243